MSIYDKVQEEIDDIMSSGMGDMDQWHRKELTKLFEPLSKKEKRKMFKLYSENIVTCESWEIEEVNFIGELCGVKDIKLTISFK